jgi:dolichol-phosphate mannosyltransferase
MPSVPLIFTATYNEADNLPSLIADIFRMVPECHVLVVDDASPDGTGELVDRLAESDGRIKVIHRSGKLGLGTAHELAMRYAIRVGYPVLVTMDADYSHHPKYLPVLLEKLQGADFVIGSRYAPGGSCDYVGWRRALSQTANAMARLLLGLKLSETTTAYRGYTLELLRRMPIDQIRSEGYSFFIESLWTLHRLSSRLAEFPIHFEDRRAGTSKINKKEILKGMTTLFRLTLGRMAGQRLPVVSHSPSDALQRELPCSFCQSPYSTEVYAATTSGKPVDGEDGRIAVYHCTNTMHRSHGRIVRCLVCGLVQTSPRPDPKKLLESYADVEDPVYVQNLPARVETFRSNWQAIQNYLPKSGRLLDVGSYCGVFLDYAKSQGFDVQGVEPSRWASAFSRQHFGVAAHTGTLKSLPGSQSEFDLVTSWDVLEHVDDPQAELKEISERLREGGVFAFCTLEFRNWLPRLLGERWPWLMDMHLYYFDDRTLRLMLKKAGLEVLHCQPYCHVITADYFLYKLDSLGVPGAKWVRKGLAWTPLARVRIPFRFGDIQLYVCKKMSTQENVWKPKATDSAFLRRTPKSSVPVSVQPADALSP